MGFLFNASKNYIEFEIMYKLPSATGGFDLLTGPFNFLVIFDILQKQFPAVNLLTLERTTEKRPVKSH